MAAPNLTVSANGTGAIDADYLNGLMQSCDTIAQLRDFIGTQGVMVFCRGSATAGDGAQGWFWWNPSSSAADNGISVIIPNGVTTGAWLRLPYIIGIPRVFTGAGSITVATSDDVIYVNKASGAATTVNLPTVPFTGETHTIKDAKGDAASNNITITPAGGYLIDGAATMVISTNYGVRKIQFNGSAWSAIG